MMVRSLYAHVPFCAKKCHYCAFYSAPAARDVTERYVTALCAELERIAPRLKLNTVFFGGGTPSLLTVKQWQTVLQNMERLGLLGAAEWTIECNPATVSLEKAQLWRQFGVNRISMGIQSLNPQILELLGRIHTRETVFQSYDLLRRAGFTNVNVDLLFAIPGQTLSDWQSTLQETIALHSEHLSCYELTYEEDTQFFRQWQAGEICSDENLACDMYDLLINMTGAAGLHHYEISNFARQTAPGPFAIPNRACQHNVNYWRGGTYYGIGPSACSFVDGVRAKNIAHTDLYCLSTEAGRTAQEYREQLFPLARAGEIAAIGLRLVDGWPFATFQQVTGFDLRTEWASEIQELVQIGHARCDETHLRLTSEGLRFADAAAEKFIVTGSSIPKARCRQCQ